MSSAEENVASPSPQEFVLGLLEGKLLRFGTLGDVPEGAETFTSSNIGNLTKDQIAELYSTVVGIAPKNFKDKKIAVESLTYQVLKMPIFDPAKPKMEPKSPTTTAKVGAPKKAAEMFELFSPTDIESALKDLAPQARELVSIMIELAKEKDSTKFSASELGEKLKVPEVAARLKTRQDPLRILQYYKGKLIGSGFIRVS